MKHFKDRVIVITGAGSGIGLATALAFARHGARLHLVDVHQQRVQEAAAQAQAVGAGAATAHPLDCTDPVQMDDLSRRVFSVEGRVDLLQNGVGALVAAAVEELSLEDWQRAVNVNLWSVIHGVRAFVPPMLKQPGPPPHLVNVASFSGLIGFPFTAPYSTTKFAVVGLSEVLSAELSGRLHVTAVCPGAVRTNLFRDGVMNLPGGWNDPLRRVIDAYAVSPEHVATQILRAVSRRRRVVVPSLWLHQVWRMKRWSGELFSGASDRFFACVRLLARDKE